jgi:hypothetical protein
MSFPTRTGTLFSCQRTNHAQFFFLFVEPSCFSFEYQAEVLQHNGQRAKAHVRYPYKMGIGSLICYRNNGKVRAIFGRYEDGRVKSRKHYPQNFFAKLPVRHGSGDTDGIHCELYAYKTSFAAVGEPVGLRLGAVVGT